MLLKVDGAMLDVEQWLEKTELFSSCLDKEFAMNAGVFSSYSDEDWYNDLSEAA